MTWKWILISNGGNFEVWSTLQGLGRYQGRFDNDVLMSKGVLCANDHKVAWALGKRTIRIWSSLNCSQALQSNQLEESEACKEASHVFTCCVRRGYVSFEHVSIFSEKTYFHGWSTMNRRTSWKDMNALETFEAAFTGLDYMYDALSTASKTYLAR